MGRANRLGIFFLPLGVLLMFLAFEHRADAVRSIGFALGGLFVIYLGLFVMLRNRREERT